MANWEKLNEEFETVLDNLTDEQLSDWVKQKELRKSMRRVELQLLARIQAQKIALKQVSGLEILSYTIESSILYYSDLPDLDKVHYKEAGENNYAMAA